MHHDSTSPPPPVAWRWLLILALLRLALHLLTNGQYGFHRDELAFWDDSQRLAWGYVAYPPLTPFVAHVSMQLFGDSLAAYRLPSALMQAMATLVTGLIARELGGQRAAQCIAAIAVSCIPFSLLAGSMLQYTSPDYLWWCVCAWLLLKLANGRSGHWWLVMGLTIGLGMLTRYTMLFCVAGVLVAVLATPLRRDLRGPWLWAGVAVSLLMFAPNAWWQWRNDFIYLDFVAHIHARDVRIGRTDDFLLGQLLVGSGPLLVPLWLAGLGWLAFARRAARGRALVWLYVTALALFWLADARDYYLAPAYPMLLAGGAVALQSGLQHLQARTRSLAGSAVAAWLLLAFAAAAAIALPVWPIGSTGWRIAQRTHDNFAEQVGWPELVAQVAKIYHALPPSERAHTAIYANNYGEAGAINRYGAGHGLPHAISAINSYWALGYGPSPPGTVIVLGDDAQGIADTPAECRLVGRVRIPLGVENEESGHPDIYLCRHLRIDWKQMWVATRTFG